MVNPYSETFEGYGHYPSMPVRVGRQAPALGEDTLAALATRYVPDIADIVGSMYTMDAALHDITGSQQTICGQALTVKCPPGDNWAIHAALTLVRPGDILVVDWRGFTGAAGTGADALVVPHQNGLVGIVVDGAWRDIEEVRTIGVPIFGRGVSPAAPIKCQLGEINTPVHCAGVVCEAGDAVIAGPEGIAVVPSAQVAFVLENTKPYVHRTAISDWPAETLMAKSRARREHYFDKVRAMGGTVDYLDLD